MVTRGRQCGRYCRQKPAGEWCGDLWWIKGKVWRFLFGKKQTAICSFKPWEVQCRLKVLSDGAWATRDTDTKLAFMKAYSIKELVWGNNSLATISHLLHAWWIFDWNISYLSYFCVSAGNEGHGDFSVNESERNRFLCQGSHFFFCICFLLDSRITQKLLYRLGIQDFFFHYMLFVTEAYVSSLSDHVVWKKGLFAS